MGSGKHHGVRSFIAALQPSLCYGYPMARPLRLEYPGALYHVTSRGNAGRKIFRGDKDRLYFLELLGGIVERFHWLCHAYCLMDTHYHLVIETSQGNLAKGMRQINGMYTRSYNRRHKKTGHVFQGRYKAIVVDKDSHLLELCRYVVLNPIRAYRVEKPEAWKWSSYGATAGMAETDFLTTDWLLSQFTKRKNKAHVLYQRFVLQGIHGTSPWNDLKGQLFPGDTRFIERVKACRVLNDNEVPRFQRDADRPSLAMLFQDTASHDRFVRNKTIHTAHVVHHYTLKEVGDQVRLHYTTVSRIIRDQHQMLQRKT
jgi:putative transposase